MTESEETVFNYFLSLKDELTKMIKDHGVLYFNIDVTNKVIAKTRELNKRWNERAEDFPELPMVKDGFRSQIRRIILKDFDGPQKSILERYL